MLMPWRVKTPVPRPKPTAGGRREKRESCLAAAGLAAGAPRPSSPFTVVTQSPFWKPQLVQVACLWHVANNRARLGYQPSCPRWTGRPLQSPWKQEGTEGEEGGGKEMTWTKRPSSTLIWSSEHRTLRRIQQELHSLWTRRFYDYSLRPRRSSG